MVLLVDCHNHKLALCFKHLLKEFPCVAEFDIALLSLWKYFHYRPLAVNFLQEFAEVYNENQALPVCPSATRWTSHGRACKALYEDYRAQIGALTVCYNERKEPEALGIFMAITSEIFTASILMLRDVFKAIAPPNLVLQTGNEQLCLTDVITYVLLTRSKLENLMAGEMKWFKEENFDDMACKAQQQTLSLPPSVRLWSADTSFRWEHYVTDVFKKLLSGFIEQLDVAFEQVEFWMAFGIFDPRKLPEKKEDLIQYANNELQDLGEHHGTWKVNRLEGKVNAQDGDTDTTALTAEWPLPQIDNVRNTPFKSKQSECATAH